MNGMSMTSSSNMSNIKLNGNTRESHYIIPDGVVEIPEGSFKGNTTLQKVTIPTSVKVIKSDAFRYCSELKEVEFAQGCQLHTIRISAFWECERLETLSGMAQLKHLKKIELLAFYRCYQLKALNFPTSLKSIGDSAFSHCSSIKRIILPNPCNLEFLDSSAFEDCKALESIDFTNATKLKKILRNAFFNCERLQSVKLPPGLQSLGHSVFKLCPQVISLVIPASVKSIPASTLPDNLQFIRFQGSCPIAHDAFEDCKALRWIQMESLLQMNRGNQQTLVLGFLDGKHVKNQLQEFKLTQPPPVEYWPGLLLTLSSMKHGDSMVLDLMRQHGGQLCSNLRRRENPLTQDLHCENKRLQDDKHHLEQHLRRKNMRLLENKQRSKDKLRRLQDDLRRNNKRLKDDKALVEQHWRRKNKRLQENKQRMEQHLRRENVRLQDNNQRLQDNLRLSNKRLRDDKERLEHQVAALRHSLELATAIVKEDNTGAEEEVKPREAQAREALVPDDQTLTEVKEACADCENASHAIAIDSKPVLHEYDGFAVLAVMLGGGNGSAETMGLFSSLLAKRDRTPDNK